MSLYLCVVCLCVCILLLSWSPPGALVQQLLKPQGNPMMAFFWQIIANHHMQSISFASGGDTVRRG